MLWKSLHKIGRNIAVLFGLECLIFISKMFSRVGLFEFVLKASKETSFEVRGRFCGYIPKYTKKQEFNYLFSNKILVP